MIRSRDTRGGEGLGRMESNCGTRAVGARGECDSLRGRSRVVLPELLWPYSTCSHLPSGGTPSLARPPARPPLPLTPMALRRLHLHLQVAASEYDVGRFRFWRHRHGDLALFSRLMACCSAYGGRWAHFFFLGPLWQPCRAQFVWRLVTRATSPSVGAVPWPLCLSDL